MDQTTIIKNTAAYVKDALQHDSSGHDWWHVYRVWQLAIRIGRLEGVELFVVELSALLHDIADFKLHNGNETVGPRLARSWLERQGVNRNTLDHVIEIIETMSFKGANVRVPMRSREGMVVQDADRLDALGAIGIARTFAFGGFKGRSIHDPQIRPEYHTSFEAYKTSYGPTINHFYEKLLLLKERINTDTAKQIAAGRHNFMEQFLIRFFLEWDGQDGPDTA
jgi:uncharacterized protein